MDENPTKRRGPLIWFAGRSRRFWIVLAILLPFAYLLGSGPTRTISIRRRMSYAKPAGRTAPALFVTQEYSLLWMTFYAPLQWASEQVWGEPIRMYWALFPIPTVIDKP